MRHAISRRGAWAVFRVVALLALTSCGSEARIPQDTRHESGVDATEFGFQVRLDSDRADPSDFRLSDEGGALHILTGPAGIAFHPQDRIGSGAYRMDATFTQFGAPVGYREAYGVFIGGRDLRKPDVEYTYFLVRPTGEYLIKRRVADGTEVLVDWTGNVAVHRVAAAGDEPVNTLTVRVGGDEVSFQVNGLEVGRLPVAEVRPYGIVGIRVNHRLDVQVTDWRLVRESPAP